MTSDEHAADLGADATSWRDMAVARSLDPARARAEKRVQRFLDAALELMSSSDTKDFTVQQVVERSGQSLRSFYQYFAGKYELLLALFEEAVRSTADHLAGAIEHVEDPLERLHVLTGEYYRLCQPGRPKPTKKGGPPRAMAEFAQQLLTEHPKEASQAFVPLVRLFREVLADAADAGVIRTDLDHQRIAGVILEAIMFNAFASTISGTPRADSAAAASELWELLLHGLEPQR